MKAKVTKKTKHTLIISWSSHKGFGTLTMKWNQEQRRFIVDSEHMGIDTVIEIFKALDEGV